MTSDTVADLSELGTGLSGRLLTDPDVDEAYCRDEAHQTELIERFDGEGLKCRALIS